MDNDKVNSSGAQPGDFPPSLTPVNPYAPAGAPYAPGSNTPPPSFAAPAVPNTSADGTYTNFSTSASPLYAQDQDQLQATAPKRTKKVLLIVLVSLVLIASVALAVGLIIKSSSKPGGSAGATPLNSYLNYLTSGSDSDSSASDSFDPSRVYYAETALSEIKGYDQKVANELVSRWDKVYNSLGDELKNNVAIKDYNDLLVYFQIRSTTSPLSDKELLEAFNSGKGTSEYLASYYAPYADSPSHYAKEYGELLKEYDLAVLAKFQIYSENGCLVNNNLDDECLDDKELNAEDNVVLSAPNQLMAQKTSFASNLPTALVMDIWDVNRIVNGGIE